MNGGSKRKSSRLLAPMMELNMKFPNMQHWQGHDIVYKLQKREANPLVQHPCMSTWGKYMYCLRRYAGSLRRCVIEGSLHKQCLDSHQDWRPDEHLNYLKVLETFKIFNETPRFKYPKVGLDRTGAGTVFDFERSGQRHDRFTPPQGGKR
eukprot:GDKI01044347.1.p1 GENE.GDKI01044347.1~~GDKI01044347.1.p1  ORF type:complete len:150 (-),score=23.49 GDKI01044347.1:175-624(-)